MQCWLYIELAHDKLGGDLTPYYNERFWEYFNEAALSEEQRTLIRLVILYGLKKTRYCLPCDLPTIRTLPQAFPHDVSLDPVVAMLEQIATRNWQKPQPYRMPSDSPSP